MIGGLFTILMTDGVRALRRRPVLERALIYGAVLLVLLLVVCYAGNTANPVRTGSWIPLLD